MVADSKLETKQSLPALVWLIPTLVVLGNLGYLVWLNQDNRGLSGIGAVLVFMFVVAPESVLFLAVYAAILGRLRSSPHQRGTLLIVALSSLAGLVACACVLGLLIGAFWLG
jgi:hypothetical protein